MSGHLTEAEYEQLRTELEQSDNTSSYTIAYALSALSGGVFTAVCLGIGAWVGGLL